MPTRRTDHLRSGDTATTPDGGRSGMVRTTYPGGVGNDQPGRTTVQYVGSTVEVHHDTTDPALHVVGRAWVTADDDVQWEVR
ncbi:MAG: hypothetical protein HOV94_05370 [Saccharothrix sp.]|nr:hypothetical protein [Saccharothrix sp.]